jgi:predicted acetyltransferase
MLLMVLPSHTFVDEPRRDRRGIERSRELRVILHQQPDMSLRVDEATIGEAATLRNLGELYVYDFSEITSTELNASGRFDHDFWHDCWTGDRTPYLFRVDDRLAGFAIVARGSRLADDPAVHDLAEFFVVRRYRRQGVGTGAAAALFERRRGRWEVRQRTGNAAARAFWHKAIGAYTNGRFDELVVADDRWHGWVQRFVS